jgi:hypothetical protein
MKYTFGDIVIVEGENIGVIVKSWIGKTLKHDIYVRVYNKIIEYEENEIERYLVRHKYLPEEEKKYQYNAINNL